MARKFPRGWRAITFNDGYSVEKAMLFGCMVWWPIYRAGNLDEAIRLARRHMLDGQIIR